MLDLFGLPIERTSLVSPVEKKVFSHQGIRLGCIGHEAEFEIIEVKDYIYRNINRLWVKEIKKQSGAKLAISLTELEDERKLKR